MNSSQNPILNIKKPLAYLLTVGGFKYEKNSFFNFSIDDLHPADCMRNIRIG